LDPLTYENFRLTCSTRGFKRVNRIVEAFMFSAVQNPVLIEFVVKQNPSIFHELSDKEERVERVKRVMEDVEKVLEGLE
jgi:hypothetical protein